MGWLGPARMAFHLFDVWLLTTFVTLAAIKWLDAGSGPSAGDLLLTVAALAFVLLLAGLWGRPVMPLTRTGGGLIAWVVMVLTAGGLITVAAVHWFGDIGDPGNYWRAVMAGLPYTFVAALLVPHRATRVVAIIAAVAALVVGFFLLPDA
jgi:hypothetical protein